MALLKRLWVLPILAILAIAVVAAACGDNGEESTATRTPSASPTATRPAATATPATSPTRPAATATPAATAMPAPTATAAATATPATTTPTAGAAEIDVVAQAFAFNKKTIEVTAGQPFTIKLDNKDSVPHNFHIFAKKGGDSIAVTDPQAIQPGSTGTLTTTITQPGDYYFQCDFHSGAMNGTLTVK